MVGQTVVVYKQRKLTNTLGGNTHDMAVISESQHFFNLAPWSDILHSLSRVIYIH